MKLMPENIKTWPKVSVAITTYNQKDFLRECIESVLAQEYPGLEIVVADDASTDGTRQMLTEYENNYPGLFTLAFAEKNRGITANSNAAFFACTGKYIAFIAGDDLMLPGKLKKQIQFLETHTDYVICYHDLDVFDSDTNRTLRYFNSGPKSFYPHQGGGQKLVQYGSFMGSCSVVAMRSACPKHGYDERMPYASEQLLFIETAINGKIGFIGEVLGRYRRHAKNITNLSSDRSTDMITLAIVDARYPHLAKYTRLHRARYLYSLAVEKILAKQSRPGRKFLFESLRHGWVSWKWFGWLLISLW